MRQPNVLFLDEPTNDLDIQTLAVLEEFLDHFQGSLIVVSHDRYFLDRTVDFMVKFEAGQIGPRYPTPYSTFQQLQAQAEREAMRIPSAKPQPDRPAQEQPHPRKLSWREQQELAGLESQIETLETERARLQAEINAHSSDYIRLQTLVEQLQRLEAEIEAKTERWLELSEVAAQD
jgi:ATP-binding cassette subfamily F protein uup